MFDFITMTGNCIGELCGSELGNEKQLLGYSKFDLHLVVYPIQVGPSLTRAWFKDMVNNVLLGQEDLLYLHDSSRISQQEAKSVTCLYTARVSPDNLLVFLIQLLSSTEHITEKRTMSGRNAQMC